MISELNDLDTRLFLLINGWHNSFFDPIMYWVSNKWFWIPFYIFILILLARAYKNRVFLIMLFIALTITVSDQISSGIIKPLVGRLRPSHNPMIENLVHLNLGGPGGLHGFVSGHAANSFALLVFLTLILSRKFNWLKWVLLFWALLVCYSRVYNGVHYPGDIAGGILVGGVSGWVMAKIYERISKKRTTE